MGMDFRFGDQVWGGSLDPLPIAIPTRMDLGNYLLGLDVDLGEGVKSGNLMQVELG